MANFGQHGRKKYRHFISKNLSYLWPDFVLEGLELSKCSLKRELSDGHIDVLRDFDRA